MALVEFCTPSGLPCFISLFVIFGGGYVLCCVIPFKTGGRDCSLEISDRKLPW